jgi:hypothetical protein
MQERIIGKTAANFKGPVLLARWFRDALATHGTQFNGNRAARDIDGLLWAGFDVG